MIVYMLALSIVSQSTNDRSLAAAYIAVAAVGSKVDTSEEYVPDSKPEPEPTPAIPRVQLLIFTGKYCQPCLQLKAAIQKQLIDDMIVAGKKPWNISEDRSALMRYVSDDKYPNEFTKRNIKGVPHLVWRVDGIETITNEREPSKLADEWNKRFKELTPK